MSGGVETSHKILVVARAAKSLVEGQRLSHMEKADTGSPSDIEAEIRPRTSDGESSESAADRMIEKGFSEELAVSVALGVLDWESDCVGVREGVEVGVRLAAWLELCEALDVGDAVRVPVRLVDCVGLCVLLGA